MNLVQTLPLVPLHFCVADVQELFPVLLRHVLPAAVGAQMQRFQRERISKDVVDDLNFQRGRGQRRKRRRLVVARRRRPPVEMTTSRSQGGGAGTRAVRRRRERGFGQTNQFFGASLVHDVRVGIVGEGLRGQVAETVVMEKPHLLHHDARLKGKENFGIVRPAEFLKTFFW